MNESCSNLKAEETELNRTQYLKDLKDLSVKLELGLTLNLKVKVKRGLWWELTKQMKGKVLRTVLDNSKGSVIYFSIHMHMGHINGCLFSRRNPNQSLFLPNNIGDKTLPQIIA